MVTTLAEKVDKSIEKTNQTHAIVDTAEKRKIDLNKDGFISPIESIIPVLERTIKRTQQWSVMMLLIIVSFLLLSALFNEFGIQVSW